MLLPNSRYRIFPSLQKDPSCFFPVNYSQPPTAAAAAAKSLQSCLTLCDPMDSSPPGSSVHGLLQARILEWVAISFSPTHQRHPLFWFLSPCISFVHSYTQYKWNHIVCILLCLAFFAQKMSERCDIHPCYCWVVFSYVNLVFFSRTFGFPRFGYYE